MYCHNPYIFRAEVTAYLMETLRYSSGINISESLTTDLPYVSGTHGLQQASLTTINLNTTIQFVTQTKQHMCFVSNLRSNLYSLSYFRRGINLGAGSILSDISIIL